MENTSVAGLLGPSQLRLSAMQLVNDKKKNIINKTVILGAAHTRIFINTEEI
jgi:hypothetical protein